MKTDKPGKPAARAAMLLAWLAVIAGASPATWAAPDVLTIEALKERYRDEMAAHSAYASYAERACAEGYPNIAHLFRALATSEGIHAQNFRELLTGHGVDVESVTVPEPRATATTRDNLKHASGVEKDEIDREYPAILERIAAEGNQDAITSITYAWKAEQQHRELIVKIHKAASRFFGLLVGRIEGGESHYHVCAVCGSTLHELPASQCPICQHPVSSYSAVDPYPGDACQAPAAPEQEWRE